MTFCNFFDLLLYKTRANLRAEVSRLYLNYIWWVIEPLFTFGIMYAVFGVFMNSPTPHYAVFLLVGLIQWQWFASTTLHAASSIRYASGLMLQVNILKIFFPLEIFLQDSFKHLFVLFLMFVFLLFYPLPLTEAWISLPLLFILQGLFIIALGIFFAATVPFVPDLQQIYGTCIHVGMFVSGVFFNPELFVKPEHLHYMYLNPMTGLLREYRRVIIDGQWPNWGYLGWVFVGTCIFLAISVYIVQRCDKIYPRICQQ